MSTPEPLEDEISLKSYFVPFTTPKAILWIVIIGIIVYFSMLFNGFIWDDKSYILFNPEIKTFNIFNVFQPNMFNQAGNYRPIPALFFAAQFGIFNDTAFFYHLSQLLLHIINTSLLFLLFEKFINKRTAFLLAIIFLVHPMQIESVSYIASTGNPLFFFFGITALLLSLKDTLRRKDIYIISGLLLLALLSKETGILFFVLILAYRLFQKKRIALALFVGGLSALTIYCIMRFSLGKVFFSTLQVIPIHKLPLSERLQNIPEIIFYYLKTFFYPVDLHINQLWVVKSMSLQTLVFVILFSIAVILFGLNLFMRNKKYFYGYVFFTLWFYLGLGMHLQVIPLDMTVADRWFYFPIAGLLGMIGILVQSSKVKLKQLKVTGYLFAFVTVVIFSSLTINRNFDWKDAMNLYLHDSKIQTNHDLENMLGSEYEAIKDYDNALIHYKKSRELNDIVINTYNIGHAYELKGNNLEARKYYELTISEAKQKSLPPEQLVVLYIRLARVKVLTEPAKNSENFIDDLAGRYPDSGQILLYQAITKYRLDKREEALHLAEKAHMTLQLNESQYIYDQILNNKPIEVVP